MVRRRQPRVLLGECEVLCELLYELFQTRGQCLAGRVGQLGTGQNCGQTKAQQALDHQYRAIVVDFESVRVKSFSTRTPGSDVDGDVGCYSGKAAAARVQEARVFSRSGLCPLDCEVKALRNDRRLCLDQRRILCRPQSVS